MAYEYQLIRAYLRERKDITHSRYVFIVNDKTFVFVKYTDNTKGFTKYSITGYGTLVLTWYDNDGFNYINIKGDTLNMLNSVLLDQFGVTMPKLG